MDIDLKPFFDQYKALVKKADVAFETIREAHGECVTCKQGCSDCCFALFDLTLIEALYINAQFQALFSEEKKASLLDKANRADRRIYKIKRQAYRHHEAGKDPVEILSRIGSERVRCPLLGDDALCVMYEDRPITCRLYGAPVNIQGMTHTCGKTAFEQGKKYPTVYMDKIQEELYRISNALVSTLKTRHARMGDMLVPLSMALLTVYDDAYMGLGDAPEEKAGEGEWKTSAKKKKHGKKQSSILCRFEDSGTS